MVIYPSSKTYEYPTGTLDLTLPELTFTAPKFLQTRLCESVKFACPHGDTLHSVNKQINRLFRLTPS